MKKIKISSVLMITLCCLFASNKLYADKGILIAGTARINITPIHDEPIHDSLYARVLILELNEVKLAFVSVDQGIYTSEKVEKVCKERYGVSQLFLSSSHTHSSGKLDADYVADRIIKAVGFAMKDTFSARISAGSNCFPQLGFNRLIVREDGHSRESWYSDDHYTSENPERIPFGPVDPEVGVIKIEDLNGQARAILMNYACHADIVCQNYEISADYPRVACHKVEEAFGKQLTCLFMQGAAGDIESLIISSRRNGPKDKFKTDYRTIERVGGLLAYETVKLSKSLTQAVQKETNIRYLDDSLGFVGRFNKSDKFNIHLATILINENILIATCPGEPFIRLQLDWKKKMRETGSIPFLFGYTWNKGTWPDYIADIQSAARGGYGADQNSPVLIQVGAGETIMNKHFENYFHLTGLMRDQPGPVGFKGGSQWVTTEIPSGK